MTDTEPHVWRDIRDEWGIVIEFQETPDHPDYDYTVKWGREGDEPASACMTDEQLQSFVFGVYAGVSNLTVNRLLRNKVQHSKWRRRLLHNIGVI